MGDIQKQEVACHSFIVESNSPQATKGADDSDDEVYSDPGSGNFDSALETPKFNEQKPDKTHDVVNSDNDLVVLEQQAAMNACHSDITPNPVQNIPVDSPMPVLVTPGPGVHQSCDEN